MSSYYDLSAFEVGVASATIVVAGAVSVALRLGLERRLAIASVRTIAQLLLIGTILRWIFARKELWAVGALMLVMTVIAGIAAVNRTRHRFPSIYVSSVVAVMASSWIITAIALSAVISPEVWSERPAQYAIPLLGMLLGNALTGIALGLDRLGNILASERAVVELRLGLGATRWEAARPAIREAVRTGMIPIINVMMVVGLVSLPGMMTGQLLSGVDPLSAVEYQIAILFLIAAATSLGTMGVVMLAYRQLFSRRHQFLYKRLVVLTRE